MSYYVLFNKMIFSSTWTLLFFQASHFRGMYSKIISDKHDDIIAKFGAILAQGILDAGLYLCHYQNL